MNLHYLLPVNDSTTHFFYFLGKFQRKAITHKGQYKVRQYIFLFSSTAVLAGQEQQSGHFYHTSLRKKEY